MPILRAKKSKDRADFDEATRDPDRVASLETMMRLAVGAVVPAIRRWAAVWLLENFNVRVVEGDHKGPRHATPAPSNDVR
jgi:hypothetical protein